MAISSDESQKCVLRVKDLAVTFFKNWVFFEKGQSVEWAVDLTRSRKTFSALWREGKISTPSGLTKNILLQLLDNEYLLMIYITEAGSCSTELRWLSQHVESSSLPGRHASSAQGHGLKVHI